MSHPDTSGPRTDRPEPDEGQVHDRIAILALAAIGVHLLMRPGLGVDEFFRIGPRMTTIALESAVGGITISAIGIAAAGHLPPVAGAIVLELIDVGAVLNALRVATPPKALSNY